MQKAIFIGVPALALVSFLVLFALFCAFPLSKVGDLFGNQPTYHPGYVASFVEGSVALYYLVAFGLLALLPVLAPWHKALIAAAVAVGLGVWSALALWAAAISGGHGGRNPLFWPFERFADAAVAVTAPARFRHYVRHISDGNRRFREIARFGIKMWLEEQKGRGRGDTHLQGALISAFYEERDRAARISLGGTLLRIGPLSPALLQGTLDAMRAPDPERRSGAVFLLTNLEHGGPAAIDALHEMAATDKVAMLRHRALRTMGERVPKDPRLERLLVAAIDRGEPFGAAMLFDIRPEDPRIPQAYARFLSAADAPTRCAWIDSIGEPRATGSYAPEDDTYPTESQSERLGSRGTEMLKATDPGVLDLKARLSSGLKDPDPRVRVSSVGALERVYEGDREAGFLLAGALRDTDEGVRRSAVRAVGPTKAVEPAVRSALVASMTDASTRGEASYTLSKRTIDDPAAQTALVDLLQEGKAPGRNVRLALQATRIEDAALQRKLAACLRHADPEVREVAAEILRDVAPADPEVQLALVAALRDEHQPGFAARDALEAIRDAERISPPARAALEAMAAEQGRAQSKFRARELLKSRSAHP